MSRKYSAEIWREFYEHSVGDRYRRRVSIRRKCHEVPGPGNERARLEPGGADSLGEEAVLRKLLRVSAHPGRCFRRMPPLRMLFAGLREKGEELQKIVCQDLI